MAALKRRVPVLENAIHVAKIILTLVQIMRSQIIEIKPFYV